MKYLMAGAETDRLLFQLLDRSIFSTWLDLFQEPSVAEMLAMGYLHTPEEQCEEWFLRQENRYANDLGGMNVLLDKQNKALIGQAGLLIQEVEGETDLEVAYSILPRYWNMGFATEAARKCRDYAFEQGFADTLISIVSIKNIRSEKVALKNGMVCTRQSEYRGMPVNVFRINKTDWLKMHR